MSDDTLCIWWLNQTDAEAIGAAHNTWPSYLRRQFESRYGRAGRGRLWVDQQFSVDEIPWPDTPLTRVLGGDYSGLVMNRTDLHHLATLPGVVTDLQARRIEI